MKKLFVFLLIGAVLCGCDVLCYPGKTDSFCSSKPVEQPKE